MFFDFSLADNAGQISSMYPIFKTDLSDSASSQDICVSLVKTGDHYCFVSSAWLIRFQVLDPNRKRLQNSIVEEILIRQVKSGYYH